MDKKKKDKEPLKDEEPAAGEVKDQTPSAEAEKEEKEPEPQKPEADEAAKYRAEAEDFKRKWYLVTAEYDNYRKRTASESARRYQEGRADVVKGLFPIADNLERALASCNDEATKKGLCMVLQSFESLLKEEKIEPINPLGEPFDAEQCEAIMAVEPEEGEESGTVKQVYQKGYRQGGKVLRYAQVVVIK